MPFENQQRLTRRRSSAGPTPPRKPLGGQADLGMRQNGGPRPTFLTLRDHGKVYVADLPNLSDGQLSHIGKEADEVLTSLESRINDLEQEATNGQRDNDTLIKASTKHEVTLRFIRAIQDEQEPEKEIIETSANSQPIPPAKVISLPSSSDSMKVVVSPDV